MRGASKAKMGKYQQKPVKPKRSNPNDSDAAKEKSVDVAAEVFAATMVSFARAANLGAASGQDGQLARQVESFIQLMFFLQKDNPQVESEEVDPELGSNTTGLNIEQALSAAFTVLWWPQCLLCPSSI